MKFSTIVLVGVLALGAVTAAWFYRQGSTVEDSAERLESGIARFEANEHAGAIEILAQVPSGAPEAARARYYEGSAYMLLEDYESAASKLEESLALKPEDTGTLYALGVVYYKLGNLKLARAYFGTVLEIDPNDRHAKGLMDIMAKLERQSAPAVDGEDAGGE